MLPNDSLVHTEQGLIPARELQIENFVLTSSGDYDKIIAVNDSGHHKTFCIEHQNGKLTLPYNAKVAVLLDIDGRTRFSSPEEISAGDLLIFSTNTISPKTSPSLPSYCYASTSNKNVQPITVPQFDSDLSWFFGLIHGDGCVEYDRNSKTYSVSVAFNTRFLGIEEKIMAQFNKFGLNASFKKCEGDSYKVLRAYSKQFAEYMHRYKQPHKSIKIPSFVMQGTIDQKFAYISGLFDADGTVTNNRLCIATSIYPNFLNEVQCLLASCGIPAQIYARGIDKRFPKRNNVYDIFVTGQQLVDKTQDNMEQHSFKLRVDGRVKYRFDHSRYIIPNTMLEDVPKKFKGKHGMSVQKYSQFKGEKIDFVPIKVENVVENTEEICTSFITEKSEPFISGGFVMSYS